MENLVNDDTAEWLQRFWIGTTQRTVPEGYLPLMGVRLSASTNAYDEPGLGPDGLSVETTRPARTLSANQLLWEEEGKPRTLEESSQELMEGFALWTNRYCRGNREMMSRVARLFIGIFATDDWEDRVAGLDGMIDSYLHSALEQLLSGEGCEALTTLGDRILESEALCALQISVFGFLAIREGAL